MVFWKSSLAKKLLTDLAGIEEKLENIKDFKGKKEILLELIERIKKNIPQVKADIISIAEGHKKNLPKYAEIIDSRLKKELEEFDSFASQIEKIPKFKEGDWQLDSLIDYLRNKVRFIRERDLKNEDSFQRMESGKPVIENIKEELLARKVPAEYKELTEFAEKEELFASITEPHAHVLYMMIEKEYELPPPMLPFQSDETPILINVSEDNLTSFGKLFRSIVKNKEFIDIGCGLPNPRNPAPAYAEAFGCKRYIGVDVHITTERKTGAFDIIYINDEMLSFLAKLQDGSKVSYGRFFFLSALDQEAGSGSWKFPALTKKYFEALYHEFDRVTKLGDAVLLGAKTTIPTELFEQCGFTPQSAERGRPIWVKTNPAKQSYQPGANKNAGTPEEVAEANRMLKQILKQKRVPQKMPNPE